MRERLFYIIAIVVVLFVAISYFIFLNHEATPSSSWGASQVQNSSTGNEDTPAPVQSDQKKTPEDEALSKKYWDKMFVITQGQLRKIKFYGKVIDQYGNPVEGAEVEYDAMPGHMAAGTGVARTTTGVDGIFVVKDARGDGLSIDNISKPGYEFSFGIHSKTERQNRTFANYQRFEHSVLWKEYSGDDNMYIYKVWKIERYAEVKMGKYVFEFKPDGSVYTVNFLGNRKLKFPGMVEGDIRVSFRRTESDWHLHLEGVGGGLQETDDLYMNLAPGSGYQGSVEYSYKKSEASDLRRNFYLMSRAGDVYGSIKMEILPYFNEGGAAIEMNYSVNMEKGRDLVPAPRRRLPAPR